MNLPFLVGEREGERRMSSDASGAVNCAVEAMTWTRGPIGIE